MSSLLTSVPLLLLVLHSTLGKESGSVLYPYGPSEGDETTQVEDDGASENVPLYTSFTFFNKTYTDLYVNNNGVISFSQSVSVYTPNAFPLSDGQTFVAPFWADVDNELGGLVYYRQSTDAKLLLLITEDMASHLPNLHFTATWAFVATWDKVVFYGAAVKKTNTFQAVLTTDGKRFFIILNYGDIQWTTGTQNGGDKDTGLGGKPAQAGFNSGDDTHYFNIPGSRTAAILNITETSNVNRPGRWVFQVHQLSVPGGCVFKANFIKAGETFWTEPSCSCKCQCNVDGEIVCAEEGCPINSECQDGGFYFICREKKSEETICE